MTEAPAAGAARARAGGVAFARVLREAEWDTKRFRAGDVCRRACCHVLHLSQPVS